MKPTQQIIQDFLLEAGFEKVTDIVYKKQHLGTIFVREWDASTVFAQIMELGAKHQTKKLRDALMIGDELAQTVIFNPQV